jgi:hypothetical protein
LPPATSGLAVTRAISLNETAVEAPPPVQRTPAIAWHEFGGGYRAGLIEWNTARLGPKPGEPGCRAPAEVNTDLGRDGKEHTTASHRPDS